ncbi:neprilysin isoform X2 [Brachionus plicatilis]|uniref:Neprilysin isoform X2 n=1 Tax=Brachionus plicatilis TaxID=10195 RepID=A0A3M7QBM2_BRAPC|nr:neprilysin isoform X2 [Brachionus plicatilis]
MTEMIEIQKSNTNMKKILVVVTGFIFVLSIIVTILGILLSISIHQPPRQSVCTSKSCIKAANLILKNLDESMDPCENFYKFSCGMFGDNHRIPDDQPKIDELSILRDKLAYSIADLLAEPIGPNDTNATSNAKKLFISCINEWKIEEKGSDILLNIMKSKFNGWPLLNQNKSTKSTTLIDLLIKLRKKNSWQLFDLFVSLNPKNPKKYILRLSQPEWFFNKENLLDDKLMQAYKDLMITVVKNLNKENLNLTAGVDKMLEIEQKFAMLQLDDDFRRNSTYKNMTIGQLEKAIPDFEWKNYLFGIYQDVKNVTVDENEIVLVDDWNDLKNLLIWLFVKETIPFLPKAFQEAKLEFDKIYEGTSIKQPRSLSCSNFVNTKMEYAVGRLYISRYFNSSSKKEAVEMINNLLFEFKAILTESIWIDPISRKHALEKVDSMDSKIAYSDKILNDTYLDNEYKDFIFSESDLLENYLNLEILRANFELGQIRKTHNPKEWISGPAVVNAFYSPSANQICFPAGILQSPFYDASNPKYLNYGGIGTVIGHEITHGFDDLGRLYDKDGIYHPDEDDLGLWANETVHIYKQKAQCIIEQYNNYTVEQVNKKLNGFNTQGENIADNGGLKEAFRAYKRWSEKNGQEPLLPGLENYTAEQMFFISFGQLWCGKSRDQYLIQAIINDPHSPGEFRIIGPTSNSEEFSNAFQCKTGQNNNPIKKCSVW